MDVNNSSSIACSFIAQFKMLHENTFVTEDISHPHCLIPLSSSFSHALKYSISASEKSLRKKVISSSLRCVNYSLQQIDVKKLLSA